MKCLIYKVIDKTRERSEGQGLLRLEIIYLRRSEE